MWTKRVIVGAAAVALSLLAFAPAKTQAADTWGLRYGNVIGSPGYRAQRYYSPYGHRHGGHRHGHYDWHDTSHWDYHPPELRWHGNHYHYTPGHYDFHRDGHWDYHRGRHHHHHR